MDKRTAVQILFILCFIIFLLNFIKFPVKETKEIIHHYYASRSYNSHNKIIRFVQLPSNFTHSASVWVRGEDPPRKINIIVHAPGDLISDHARKGALWETHIIDPLLAYLRNHPNLHFIDIGCNIGLFTLSVASIRPNQRQVLAVDANENNCQFLAKSLKMNGYLDQVTIVNNALDVERKEDTLFIHSSNVGGAYLQAKNELQRNPTNHELMKIHSIHFDDLLEVVNFREAVMKIDIEFSENRAFKRAKQFFQVMKVTAILVEWIAGGVHRSKEQYEELLDFFYGNNYEPYSSMHPNRQLLARPNYYNWPPDMVWMLKGYNHTFSL